MRRRAPQSGFTLTEVLVALVVLAIGMLGMSTLTVSNIAGNALNKQQTVASALLQDRMERVKRAGYAGNPSGSTPEDYNNIPGYSGFRRTTTVTANTPATNMRTVTVQVWWQKDEHSLSASTILAE